MVSRYSRVVRWRAVGLLGAVLFATTPAHLDAAAFLKVAGIQGESTANGHTGQIDLLTWGWGLENPSNRVRATEFLVSKLVDKTSPEFMRSLCTATAFSNAVLSVTIPINGYEYYRLELNRVLTASVQPAGDATRQTETVALRFDSFKFDYIVLGANGTPTATAGMNWNLVNSSGSDYADTLFVASLTYRAGDANATLSWPSVSGKTYNVLFADSLGPAFALLGSYSAGTNTQMSIPVSVDRLSRFFRVVQQ